ncbi:Hydrolase, NUDIX family [Aphelenchoides fujianensis]|nr:Hydrolase, NUDIX family [Aphelenchoides fujianensis]
MRRTAMSTEPPTSASTRWSMDGPQNPMGRTGLRGRGILGRWGPNHAADPIVSRFKDGKLQFVAIKRGDTGDWAIPGGMVDAGEEISATLKREFTEETLDNVNNEEIESLWSKGVKIYSGYVDDPSEH